MTTKRDLKKAARIIALLDFYTLGVLDHINQSEVARRLGCNRSAICRTIADLHEVVPLAQEYKKEISGTIKFRSTR